MTISIVLPEGDGLKVGRGTKVLNSDGVEIEAVCCIEISLPLDDVITAKVTVAIDKIENMNNIHALLGTKTLEDIAKLHGCEFKPININTVQHWPIESKLPHYKSKD